MKQNAVIRRVIKTQGISAIFETIMLARKLKKFDAFSNACFEYLKNTKPDFKRLAQVIKTNKAIGDNWFDRGTTEFWYSLIESKLLDSRFFITSERFNEVEERKYSIRIANKDGSIATIGTFRAYNSKDEAMNAIENLVEGIN
jgi:3-methyladenine DNA glycosylase AlkD